MTEDRPSGTTRETAPSVPYNPLFERFTDPSESKLGGLVAYALYKRAKVEWSTEYRKEHGSPPSEEARKGYQANWTATTIQAFRDQAESALAAYAQNAVEEARPGIREEALRGTFRGGVWQSIVANAIYTLALIAIVLILRWSGVDLIGLAQKLDVPQNSSSSATKP